MGIHWKSKTTIGNFPLIHIALGRNAKGEKETAQGVIAIGSSATGIIALGVTNAKGVIAVGWFSFGLITVGQFALGVATIAQFGIGLFAGVGQFIVAPICYGPFALGIAAMGEYVLGVFVNGNHSAGIFGFGKGSHLYEYDWLPKLGIGTPQLEAINQYTSNLDVIARHIFDVLPFIILGAVVIAVLWFVFTRVIGLALLSIKVTLGMVKIEEVEATILESRETGIYINKLPVIELQIEYTTLAGQHFKAKLRTPAGFLTVSKLAPGATFTVAYDPARPERAMFPRPEWKKTA